MANDYTDLCPVFFLHVPKTAGTAVRGFLENFYPASTVCNAWFIDDFIKLTPTEMSSLRLIAGHYPASVFNWIPQINRYKLITYLRDPIERTISHFYHLQFENTAALHPLAKDCSIDEFILNNNGIFDFANFQTRFLGGIDLDSEYFQDRFNITDEMAAMQISGPKIESIFERACENLECFDVIGIVEQMEKSLLLISSQLGLDSKIDMNYSNKGQLIRSSLSEKTKSRIAEINEYDLKLYSKAKAILHRKCTGINPDTINERYREKMRSTPSIQNWSYKPQDGAFIYGWHGREKLDNSEWARWSSSKNCFIDLNVDQANSYELRFRAGCYTLSQLETLRVKVNGVSVRLESVRCDAASDTQRIFKCILTPELLVTSITFIRIAFEVDFLVNPKREFFEADNRDLGVYLWWCCLTCLR